MAHQSQYTFCQLVRLAWGEWLGFLCPILEGLGISQGPLRLHQPIILTAKSHVLEWQELFPVQRLGCWWGRVIILHFGGTASHLWHLKRCLHPLGEFLDVTLAGNFSELLPPCWDFHILHVPANPLVPLGGGLSHQGLLRVILQFITGPRHSSSCQELLDLGVKSGQTLKLLFHSGLFIISPG